MRIAVLIDALARGGGVERYLADFARFLAEGGDELWLVCARGREVEGPWKAHLVDAPGRTRAARVRAFAQAAGRVAAARVYDVSVAVRHATAAQVYQPHGGMVPAAMEARLARHRGALVRRLPARLSPRRRAFERVERELVRRTGCIVAISEKVVREVATHYPEAAGKLVRAPLGVDLERFAPGGEAAELERRFGVPPGAPALLFVGYNPALKGLPQALAALATKAVLRSAHLVVCGPARLRLPRRWSAALAGRVHLAGEVQDMAPLYRAAGVLVHPTFYDPCALTTLEALACGCPVVTTRCNGAAEVGGEALALMRDPRDHDALAGGVERLLAGGEPLRASARRSVEARSQRSHFERMRHILARAAGSTIG